MKNNVIGSKIQAPKVSSAFILRNRLLDRLENGEKKLFFLHATVGHGKTVLLTQLVARNNAICAWYHLNDTDNDIMTFMQYLCEAVKKVVPDFSFDWASYGGLMQSEELLDAMLCDFSAYLSELTAHTNKEMFLVFDDFQTVKNEEIYKLIDILLKNTSSNVKLFAATKGAIPVFFMRYLLQGTTEVISQQELCFQKEEISLLISPLAATAKEGEALTELVYKHTEGWPAGIMFAVLYLKQNYRSMESGNVVIYEKTAVHGYLMHEIYRKLPYDIQIFLTETSVLDFLSGDICNAVTGRNNSQSVLEYLVQENLFILRMGPSDKVFRYHSLFKDFLNKQVNETRQREIQNAAASFYLNSQTSVESREQAVEYAIRSGNSQLVQYALEGIGMELLNQGKLVTLERWIAFLTEKELKLTPQNMLIGGVFFYQKGNVEKALRYIDQAKEMFLSSMDENGYVRCMVEKANVIRNCMSLEESNLILDQIMPRLKNKNSVLLFSATKERIYNFLFLCRYKEALAICSETILTARRMGNKKIEQQFALISVVIFFYMGKYGRALELYDAFTKKESAEAAQTAPFSVNAYGAFLMMLYGRGEEAEQLIDQELEQKLSQKRKEDIWLVYLFKACIYAMSAYCSSELSQAKKNKIYAECLKALNIAEKYTGYWAEKHVFYGYIKTMKTALLLSFDAPKYQDQMGGWVAEWKDAYPFARDFALGHLAVGLYQKGEIRQALACASGLLQLSKWENLFTVYARGVTALAAKNRDEDQEAALRNAALGQLYLSENKLDFKLFTAEDQQYLKHLADEGEKQDRPTHLEMKKIRVKAFGDFEVFSPRSETPVKFRTKKAQELCAYLFHLQGRTATKESIILELWPETGEKSGTSLLHTTLYGVRKALQVDEIEDIISYKDKKYTMDMNMITSDLGEFNKLTTALIKGDVAEARKHKEWIESYGGSYLADINSEFAQESRTYYERRYLKCCKQMAQKEIEAKDYEAAIYYLVRAIHVDGYAENLHLLLIKCYGRLGDIKSAKQCYETMCRIWVEELGIEPALSLNELLKGFLTGLAEEERVSI